MHTTSTNRKEFVPKISGAFITKYTQIQVLIMFQLHFICLDSSEQQIIFGFKNKDNSMINPIKRSNSLPGEEKIVREQKETIAQDLLFPHFTERRNSSWLYSDRHLITPLQVHVVLQKQIMRNIFVWRRRAYVWKHHGWPVNLDELYKKIIIIFVQKSS